MAEVAFEEREYLACCGSAKFAKFMALASPFASYDLAVQAARDIWFNKVDVNGLLEAFAAHPAIGQSAPSSGHRSKTNAQWSKGEQSTALATATYSTLQSATSRIAGLMANSDPSHDQWPPLLASHSKMQPPPARSAQPMAASGHTPTTSNLPPLFPSEPPEPRRSTQPSFAAIARPKLVFRFPPISIPSKPRILKEGKPAVTFTASELQPGIQRFQYSIIAKFTAGRPHIDDIRRCFASAWSIADLDSIGAIDARHILIIASSEEDSNKILAHPLRKVGQSLFRLFRWSPDFHRRREPTTTTTWIKLPGLPNQLYDQGYLYTIVSQFSRFIAIDHRTRVVSNPSFARVCIELDLNKPIPEEVWIGLPNSDGFWQPITYENKLSYCSRCKLHGHDLSNCRKTKPMSAAREPSGLPNQVKRDDFGLPIGKPNGVAFQEKHEKVKPLSRNKEVTITCSSEQNEAGWKMVKKRKGKLDQDSATPHGSICSLNPANQHQNLSSEDNPPVIQLGPTPPLQICTSPNNVTPISEIHDIQADQNIFVAPISEIHHIPAVDKGKISINDLTNKDLTTQDEESIDPASAMILYNEQDDNIMLPDLYLTNVGGQFSCEQLGGKIFQDQEEFAKFAEENGYVQEDSTIEYVDPSPMPKPRQQKKKDKKKGSRSSARSCPKKKDKNYELVEWNAKYRLKFGHVFLICASGRSSPEILAELKKRFSNRPIVEFEIAAQEQMKITELRLLKLIETKSLSASTDAPQSTPAVKKVEDRVTIIGGHLTGASEAAARKSSQATRPPITTHVLDVAKGCPAAGVDVRLEMWAGHHSYPSFEGSPAESWVMLGSSVTDNDGRSGQLMGKADSVNPGLYRISFNTGKYCPGGFFPYVSILFEIRESQKFEHFHVPLLFSPFSFTTYRGS
ncbi:unnamed protein product [Rhodiola kirilowii]